MAGTDLECEGGKGGDDGNDEDVDVGDHDDGALVSDALAHAGRGEGAPLVDVEDLQGVGRLDSPQVVLGRRYATRCLLRMRTRIVRV